MSEQHHDQHADHGHHDDDLAYHATVKGYVVGFLLSVVLTAIPFWLVMGQVLPSKNTTALVILAFAAVQMVVHMIYFLHMNSKVEGGWSLLALIFTAALVLIMLAGSIWVMYHMNANMMPVHDMRNLP
ncbi:cytochrome o ubiquinol oxidase subunit IV [Mitsuaria sp. WAJ17]|uniref:cytochrome o ubiquinol oxidase subunit IV n=1 Tax=Mitsuaria sp. WAJ17 TaxID=2761452 RepID=UPI0015FF5FA2|nr:cytochrome o ubiquinol oxidase subunit IV [Mitsuaria sp. WAJ17]MBB2485705.1 cytochrome o ubiquinol oxidase subunit IV [Mitsuaria sp. WAJ17]